MDHRIELVNIELERVKEELVQLIEVNQSNIEIIHDTHNKVKRLEREIATLKRGIKNRESY